VCPLTRNPQVIYSFHQSSEPTMAEKEILVTDSLFVHDEHVERLEKHGYSVSRLDKPKPSEDELVEALEGKEGYIIGGIESVTGDVIESAGELEAIVFTGAGYTEFIPGHETATEKGIAIANAPGGNSDAVAEYALTLLFSMSRGVFEIGRVGESSFFSANSLLQQTVGIVGMGRIGTILASKLTSLGVETIYYSRNRKRHLEGGLGIEYASFDELFERADAVSLHVSEAAGENFVSEDQLDALGNDGLLVNAAYPGAVDFEALRERIESSGLKAAYDAPPEEDYSSLPKDQFYCSNVQTGYNTKAAISRVSDMVTNSIINLLSDGDDQYLVNPSYRKNR